MTAVLGRAPPIIRGDGTPSWVPRGDDGRPAILGAKYTTNQFWHQGPKNDNAAFKASASGVFTRTTAKSYLNSAAVLSTAAINAEAFDFSPAAVALGLSMEGPRTNVILNNTMVGGIAGAPGTLPTGGWSTLDGGLTRTLSFGVEDGINYIDVKYAGIASGTEAFILLSTAYSAAIASGSAYTGSVFAGFAALTMPPNSADHRLYWVAGDANVSGTAIPVSVIPAGALKTKRILQTRTPTLAATGVQTRVRFALTIGNSYDFTIRIGLPQLEAGNFATSPILTSGTAVARAQDFLNFGPVGAGAELLDPSTAIISGTGSVVQSPAGTFTFTRAGGQDPTLNFSIATVIGTKYVFQGVRGAGPVALTLNAGVTQGDTSLGTLAMLAGQTSSLVFTATSTTTWVRAWGGGTVGSTVATGFSLKADPVPFVGYDQTQGAFIWEGDSAHVNGVSPAEVLWWLGDATNNINVQIISTGAIRFTVTVGGVSQALITSAFVVTGAAFRCLALWENNKFGLFVNGVMAGVIDLSGAVPSVTSGRIGSSNTGTAPLFGHIAQWWHMDVPPWTRAAALSTVGGV